MVAYQEFVSLSRSPDSEARGSAAHLSALAYLNHVGPADEHAALYAALIGFLAYPATLLGGAISAWHVLVERYPSLEEIPEAHYRPHAFVECRWGALALWSSGGPAGAAPVLPRRQSCEEVRVGFLDRVRERIRSRVAVVAPTAARRRTTQHVEPSTKEGRLRARLDEDPDEVLEDFPFGEGISSLVIRTRLPWLLDQVDSLPVDGRWHAHARGVLRDELRAQQRALAAQVIAGGGKLPAGQRVARWLDRDDPALRFTQAMFADLRTQKALDYPTVSVAVRRLAQMAAEE